MSFCLHVSGGETLAEDLTIPEDMSLYISIDAPLTVGEGVTFITIDNYFSYSVPMTVDGTWVNESNSTCNDGLMITPTGIFDNARGWIHLYDALTNEGTLTSSSSVYHTNAASSPEELIFAIEHTLTGRTIWVSDDGGDFVINKEITIPAGVTVEVYGDV